MEYRKLPKGNEQISVIGFGGSGLHQAGEKEAVETINLALENGINYFDLAVSEACTFDYYKTTFAGQRDKVCLQMHFGADYSSGAYGWTTDRKKIDHEIDRLMKKLNTDYIDFGFIHYIDEPSDLKKYIDGGVLDRIKDLKKQGVVRHIGLSTHTPEIANRMLDTGLHCHPCPKGLDIAMINKYYDLAKAGDELARDHYRKLELHASDCIRCGHCNKRCPFHVDQMARMETIQHYFGE